MHGGGERRTVEGLPRRCERAFHRLVDRVAVERLAVPALIVALVSVAGAGFSPIGPQGGVVGLPPTHSAIAAGTPEIVPALDPDRPAGEPVVRSRVPLDADLPTRRMSYEQYAQDASWLIRSLPTLDMMRRQFPAAPMTRSVGEQKAHIQHLDQVVEATVEGFSDFTIDRSRKRAFVDLERYHQRIRPKMFIVHWTGMGYRDVDHFVTSLKPYRVQFFIDHHADVYDLFETDRQKPAHALGVNDFAQGVEIETGKFDGKTSPLFSYTPEQIEQTIYLAVEFLRRNDLPVDETTLLGHYAADLIFTNPYYEPHQARFSRATLRKFDPPQELMEVIVRKASDLDQALGEG